MLNSWKKIKPPIPIISNNKVHENEKSSERRRRLGRKRKHDGQDDSINPLLNDLVLETLFQHVRRNELLTCRLVCRKWNFLSLPFIRSNLCIDIVRTGSPFGQSRGIVKFMKLSRTNPLLIPFEKFCLGSFDTTKGAGEQFIKLCGPTIKQIILKADKNDDVDTNHVVQNISNFLRSTQNLVSLTMPTQMGSKSRKIVKLFDDSKPKPTLPFLKVLDVGLEYTQKRKKICPTFYEELFEAAPNISTLCLYSKYVGNNASLEVLEIVQKLGREKSIQNISLPHLTQGHLNLFQSMSSQLRLKQLELTYECSNQNKVFYGFELIKFFKNSLVAIRIICKDYGHPNPVLITFVDQMPKLRFLELRLYSEVRLQCESFNSIFPALEKIEIVGGGINYRGHESNNILIGNEPCTIPTLKSSFIRCAPMTMGRLERIHTIFPTLKILKCSVTCERSAEVIRNIWTRMTQLEGLHIYGNLATVENIDELVTGIPATEIMNMKEFFKSLEPLEIEVRRNKIYEYLPLNLTLPSIRNLTNLKSLKLKLSGRYLSDVTGYFALYSLKNLQHLSISNCEISKFCAEMLATDKNLMSWKFKSTNSGDITPRSWRNEIKNYQNRDFPILKV